MGHRPFIVGVAGGTGSGKTTVAERLAELVGEEHLALVKLDSYYWAHDDEPLEERARGQLRPSRCVRLAAAHRPRAAAGGGSGRPGAGVRLREHTRAAEVRQVGPAKIVVIEGILVLNEPTLRELFDLRLYIDTDADLRFIRRLQRDVAQRGRTPESIIDQYLATVRPSHLQFIEPSKRHADVIIPEGGMNKPALDVILARVRELVH